MSDPLFVAVVGEGPTDGIIIRAAIQSIFGATPFVLTQLQPEGSVAFGGMGTGWGGVYRWCRQAVDRTGGAIRNDVLFGKYDILILHLDSDVADGTYEDAGIAESIRDLPCARDCPPPSATTDPLRLVMLRWVNEQSIPPKAVFCTPSKNTETWVLTALYPTDPIVTSGNLECYATPQTVLGAKPAGGRVISGGKKQVRKYMSRAKEVTAAWANVRRRCTEAERFSRDLEAFI